jgi:hypothetical protein
MIVMAHSKSMICSSPIGAYFCILFIYKNFFDKEWKPDKESRRMDTLVNIAKLSDDGDFIIDRSKFRRVRWEK